MSKKRKRTKKRKGVFEGLSNSALAFVVLVITISVGALILGQFSNLTATGGALANTNANNVVTLGLTGLTTYANFFSLLVVVIVAVAIFILILAGLGRFRGASSSTGF